MLYLLVQDFRTVSSIGHRETWPPSSDRPTLAKFYSISPIGPVILYKYSMPASLRYTSMQGTMQVPSLLRLPMEAGKTWKG